MMTGLSHTMLSWGVAQGAGEHLRDRRLAAWAGVAPDFDCVSYALGWFLYRDEGEAFFYYAQIHHRYTHGLAFVLLMFALALVFGRNRLRAGLLTAAATGLHLACDVIGSGSDWPIYLWWPLSNAPCSVPWSLTLYSTPNVVAGMVFAGLAFGLGAKYGRTPFEMVSLRLDREFVRLARERFCKK